MPPVPPFESLAAAAENLRAEVNGKLDESQRSLLGQFTTPDHVAALMASMFSTRRKTIRLLDPGAGSGALTAAFVERLCSRRSPPDRIAVVAYEVDSVMLRYLEKTMGLAARRCEQAGIEFTWEAFQEDFIDAAALPLQSASPVLQDGFDCAILNPPYRKISSSSRTRRSLRTLGIETSNLYAAFVWVTLLALKSGGEMVAITPRSFCNGPYFQPFREALLTEMALRRIHVFDSRSAAFKGDRVLQENIILHAAKSAKRRNVVISASSGQQGAEIRSRAVSLPEVVQPQDPHSFIRLNSTSTDDAVATRFCTLSRGLTHLGMEVSTGRVVDFRAREYLRKQHTAGTVPLIYPCHLRAGAVRWPIAESRKPNALVECPATASLLVPSGTYVLVKRFSSKEERRRVVAAVVDASMTGEHNLGFENHLNYFHESQEGLSLTIARGLAAYLNSELIDLYFRTFSGHTQVNATDLRNLPYPSTDQLCEIGRRIRDRVADQDRVDQVVSEEVPGFATPSTR